ncbi:MAG: hypothetical protein ACSHYA_06860 [Opitutaceae bacterium]
MSDLPLCLFGKHPAWSDHMYVGPEVGEGNRIKRLFYDQSMVPSLQNTDQGERQASDYIYLFSKSGVDALIVGVPSRDSVGRSRFPLFAAYQLPDGYCERVDESALNKLVEALFELLESVLAVPAEDQIEEWKEQIAGTVFGFVCEWDVADVGVDTEEVDRRVLLSEVRTVWSGLERGEKSFDLPEASLSRCLALAEIGRKQFKSSIPLVTVLKRDFEGEAFVLGDGADDGFQFHHFFAGNTVKTSDEPTELSTKAEGLIANVVSTDGWCEFSKIPSLKLADSVVEQIQRKPTKRSNLLLIGGASVGLIVLILVLILSLGDDSEDSSSMVAASESFPAKDKWIDYSSGYADWVEETVEYLTAARFAGGVDASLAALLAKPLNPFAVAGDGSVSRDRILNPTNRTFNATSQEQLAFIYANIDQLKVDLRGFFSEKDPFTVRDRIQAAGYELLAIDESLQAFPEFGNSFLGALDARVEMFSWMAGIEAELEALNDGEFESLRAQFPKVGEKLELFLIREVSQLALLDDFDSFFDQIETALSPLIGEMPATIDANALGQTQEWSEFKEAPPSLDLVVSMISIIKDFEIVPESQIVDLFTQLDDEIKSLEQSLDSLESDFPTSDLGAAKVRSDLIAARKAFDLEVPKNPIRKNLVLGQQAYASAASRFDEIRATLDGLRSRLSDPSVWMVQVSPMFDRISLIELREFAHEVAEQLRAKWGKADPKEMGQAYNSFKKESTTLVEALEQLNFSIQVFPELAGYLELPGSSDLLQQEASSALTAELNSSAEVDVIVDRAKSIASALVGQAATYSARSDALDSVWNSRSTSEKSASSVLADLKQLVEDSLHLAGNQELRLSLLRSIDDGNLSEVTSIADAYWSLLYSIEQKNISQELLGASNTYLASQDERFSDVDRVHGLAFRAYVKSLMQTKPEEVIRLYGRLNEYLPLEVQTDVDRDLVQMVEYQILYLAEGEGQRVPEEAELAELRDAGSSELVKGFFSELMSIQSTTDKASIKTRVDRIKQNSPFILSVELDTELDLLSISFKEQKKPFQFKRLKVGESSVFIQMKPLTLEEFFALAELVDLDLENFTFGLDNLFPKPFSQGGARGFRRELDWKFLGGASFGGIKGFSSQSDVPMHTISPVLGRELITSLGLRLLAPTEAVVLQQQLSQEQVAARRLSWTDTDLAALKDADTFGYSVYADRLKSSGTNGGIDFLRSAAPDGFVELLGGAAELAFDPATKQYSVFGGSWIYAGDTGVMPLKRADALYIDLGLRLALDAPSYGFGDRLKDLVMTNFHTHL